MRIVDIFEPNLYSFHYKDENDNEFDRLMELWTDVNYLKQFAEENKIDSIKNFINEISEYAEDIQDFLQEIQEGDITLEHYFQPLNDMEQGFVELSQQKGKMSRKRLRIML